MEIKLNGRNLSYIEGYVSKIQPISSDGKLRFELDNFSLAKSGEVYCLTIPCVLAGRPAEIFSRVLKDGHLIECEGRLRMGQDSKKLKLMVVHIAFTTPVTREIEIEDVKPNTEEA